MNDWLEKPARNPPWGRSLAGGRGCVSGGCWCQTYKGANEEVAPVRLCWWVAAEGGSDLRAQHAGAEARALHVLRRRLTHSGAGWECRMVAGHQRSSVEWAVVWGFPDGSAGEESACKAGRPGSIEEPL